MSTTKPKTTAKKTTATKATAKKSTTAKAPTAATQPVAVSLSQTAATPVVVGAPEPVISGPMMRKKELIDLVVERSGIKKKDAKPAVEATLAVLGEAIGDSRELNLQPMGKLKVHRVKQMPNGRVMVTKIRQLMPSDANAEASGTNTLPSAAE
ncbi:MAG: HU family DNA-binding protein [Ascidiaceihabitans sp.]|nr:HU family DNA-binding protein [Ascidiaceihabitans sp.]